MFFLVKMKREIPCFVVENEQVHFENITIMDVFIIGMGTDEDAGD